MTTEATKQMTQATQQAVPEDAKVAFEAVLKEHPEWLPHAVTLGKAAFEEDAKRLKASNGRLASERDQYRKAANVPADRLAELTELSALQEDAVQLAVERYGVDEDLLREWADDKRPSQITAFAKRMAEKQAGVKTESDMAARVAALEAKLSGSNAQPQRPGGAINEPMFRMPGAPVQRRTSADISQAIHSERDPRKLAALKDELQKAISAEHGVVFGS